MEPSTKLPLFDLALSDHCLGLSDSLGQTHRFGLSEQQVTYNGMSVQTVDSSSVYHNQSVTPKDNADSFNSLNDLDIEHLTLSGTNDFIGADIPNISESILDEYIPWNPENGPVNDTQSSIPDMPFILQVCLPGSEPEISAPTIVSHLNPDDQLINLSVESTHPQALRPATVVNPLNLDQRPQAEEIDGNALVKCPSQGCREDCREDSDYVGRRREYRRKYQRKYQREYYHNNPDYAERRRRRRTERYKNDFDHAERERENQRKYQRERYHNDPDYAERERERKRKRQRELRKDPIYVEGQKIYTQTYNRVIKQSLNKEEAAKQAGIAKRRYLQFIKR
ncbi:hypothetical protein [Endozoicomonas sp. SCSIO W0465]|uniref:hypothetical protein n=1 Tax=Endozoicomonas sp. SCSIO W0465 TaxID=2918516 RepID=UPI0020758B0F|nr:hypothetical protein [Endozoicomonas sp. SCSIO W0465]USE35426.1 hypothetical protein MJO57_25540 [Endozoicomonas sp. SCSIO W0465]